MVEGRRRESGSFEEGLQFRSGPRGGDEERRKRGGGRVGGGEGDSSLELSLRDLCCWNSVTCWRDEGGGMRENVRVGGGWGEEGGRVILGGCELSEWPVSTFSQRFSLLSPSYPLQVVSPKILSFDSS